MNNKLLTISQVQGRNFVVQFDDESEETSLVPVNSNTIALNQQDGFDYNNLFLQETSLIRDLVSESIKRFIADPIISSQTADSLYNLAGLYLPSAYYVQEYKVENWTCSKINLNLLQLAAQKSSYYASRENKNEITEFNTAAGMITLVVLSRIVKKPRN